MKFKTIIISVIIVMIIFLIYLTSIDKEVYYLNLGDNVNESSDYSKKIEEYLNDKQKLEKTVEFTDIDYRTTDLIRDINDNKIIKVGSKKQTLKNALIKADLITLSIGKNDIYYKINNSQLDELYEYVDEVLKDIKQLLAKIREYCKEDIIFIGIIDNNTNYPEVINYTNEKIKTMCEKQNIEFIDINKKLNINKTIDEVLTIELKNIINKTTLN